MLKSKPLMICFIMNGSKEILIVLIHKINDNLFILFKLAYHKGTNTHLVEREERKKKYIYIYIKYYKIK